MAEPRRPRIIRSRPGATPPAAPTPATPVAETRAAEIRPAESKTAGRRAAGTPVSPAPAATNPGRAGIVRRTSGKVVLTPLPGESKASGDGPEALDAAPAPGALDVAPAPETLVPETLVPGTLTAESTAAAKRVSDKVSVSVIDGGAESPRDSLPASGKPAKPAKKSKPAKESKAAEPAAPVKPAEPVNKKSFKVPFLKGGPDKDSPRGSAPGVAKPDLDSGARILAFPVPLHKRRRKRVLLTAGGLAAVLALVMAMALFSPALAVKTITFDGHKLVADSTLQAAVAPLINKPLPQVTQEDVSAMLAGVPQIKSSSIEARPPSTLLIHLVERIPVALLKSGEEFILVDQDGVKLGATTDPASVAVPLIDGGTAVIGKDTFVAITAVLATLPQSVLSMLASASATSPDAVELQLSDGRVVVWGNASDMELKAQVLDALLTAPATTAVPGKPEPVPVKVYDVSAPRHPVTR